MQQSICRSDAKIIVIDNVQTINSRSEVGGRSIVTRRYLNLNNRYMFVVLLWILCLTKTLQAATATTGMLGDDVKDTFFCHDKRFRLNKIAMRRLERTNYVLF